jgi:hypothetical protein
MRWYNRARVSPQLSRVPSVVVIAQIASLGLFMTMARALSMQAKYVLQGKDPRAMNNGDFWLRAALQGGAAGPRANSAHRFRFESGHRFRFEAGHHSEMKRAT